MHFGNCYERGNENVTNPKMVFMMSSKNGFYDEFQKWFL
jgi:hypothetical protein